MCTVCGCGTADEEKGHDHAHRHRHGPHHHAHGHDHDRGHDHDHGDDHDHDHDHETVRDRLDYGAGIAGVHLPGLSQKRIVSIERDILSRNNAYADDNRARLARAGILALNFVSSPGSGKTTLLVRVIDALKDRFPIVVIEGDQQTSNDAERIRATGVNAIQVNTGKGCHLDAHMVGHAMESLPLANGGLLFIENVGTLVCPAAVDLGEAHQVAVLSVTEGEDKPLKYPDMFAASDLMLLNKADLLPHLDFDQNLCLANALRVNPKLHSMVVSAKSGAGMDLFYAWVSARATACALSAAR